MNVKWEIVNKLIQFLPCNEKFEGYGLTYLVEVESGLGLLNF